MRITSAIFQQCLYRMSIQLLRISIQKIFYLEEKKFPRNLLTPESNAIITNGIQFHCYCLNFTALFSHIFTYVRIYMAHKNLSCTKKWVNLLKDYLKSSIGIILKKNVLFPSLRTKLFSQCSPNLKIARSSSVKGLPQWLPSYLPFIIWLDWVCSWPASSWCSFTSPWY